MTASDILTAAGGAALVGFLVGIVWGYSQGVHDHQRAMRRLEHDGVTATRRGDGRWSR